jgi:alcohol dehydrogenase
VAAAEPEPVALTNRWTAQRAPELHVGTGALGDVAESVAVARTRRPLLVTDSGTRAAGWPDRVAGELIEAGLPVTVWAGVRANASDLLVHELSRLITDGGHDGVIAVGGGSVIDVAKAAAGLAAAGGTLLSYEGVGLLNAVGPPVIAVPTTPCNGAEISRHSVIATADGRRFSVSGHHLAPQVVIADPRTTLTAPGQVRIDTVIDSLLHAIEAYLCRSASPYTDVWARSAVESIAVSAVPALTEGSTTAQAELMKGCIAASCAMANANASVVHALGYPLTSVYSIPHGRANALVAPEALRRLEAAAPERYRGLWPGRTDLADALAGLLDSLGVARGLRRYGVPKDHLPELARRAETYQPVLRNTRILFSQEELLDVYRATWDARGPVGAGTGPGPAGREAA